MVLPSFSSVSVYVAMACAPKSSFETQKGKQRVLMPAYTWRVIDTFAALKSSGVAKDWALVRTKLAQLPLATMLFTLYASSANTRTFECSPRIALTSTSLVVVPRISIEVMPALSLRANVSKSLYSTFCQSPSAFWHSPFNHAPVSLMLPPILPSLILPSKASPTFGASSIWMLSI